jgi:hypothetical protein
VESIGVCRTAEDGDECGTIKVELYSRRGFYLRMCAACPTPRFTLKDSNPVHPWEQHLWYVPLSGLGRIQHSCRILIFHWRIYRRDQNSFVRILTSIRTRYLPITSYSDLWYIALLEALFLPHYEQDNAEGLKSVNWTIYGMKPIYWSNVCYHRQRICMHSANKGEIKTVP